MLFNSHSLTKANEKIESARKVTEETPTVYEAKVNLAIVHSIWLKTKKQYEESLNKLKEAENLIENADIEEKYGLRYLTTVAYYQAELYNCSENPNRDPEMAKTLFNQVCQQGRAIEWSRYVNYAQNELANITISEQDYDEAAEIIDRGLREAKVCRESTRIGHWLASSWRLALAQGNLEQARKEGEKALAYFSAGGGKVKDAKEINEWLQENNFF